MFSLSESEMEIIDRKSTVGASDAVEDYRTFSIFLYVQCSNDAFNVFLTIFVLSP